MECLRTFRNVVASLVTTGLLIGLAGLAATSSPRQVTTVTTRLPAPASPQSSRAVPAPDTQGVVLIDAPGTTGTVNLGGVTAGLDDSSFGADLSAPDGPQFSPDIEAGVEPGTAVDGLVVPLVDGLSNGSGDVAVQTPRLATIDPINVDVSAGGAVGLRVKTANAVSINPGYKLTRAARPRLDLTGTYACAKPGSRLFVNDTERFEEDNRGGAVDYVLVCDGTTRTWSVSVQMDSEPQGTVEVTADLTNDQLSLARAERDVAQQQA